MASVTIANAVFATTVFASIPPSASLAAAPISPPVANFACLRHQGKLATVVKTKKGHVPVVIWDSTAFSSAGFSPVTRCKTVTRRFKSLHSSGRLKYLTAGQLNSQPVICATMRSTDNCTAKNLLFTLKPGSAPQGVLQRLNDIRNRVAKNIVVEESAAPITSNPSNANSVDMDDWLKFADNDNGN